MRHIRTRRRFKLILIFLLLASIAILIDNSIENILPQIKGMAELKVEEAFGRKIKVSIGQISGGLTRPISFNDIRISQSGANIALESLIINNIRTNYRIWDIIKVILGRGDLPSLIDKDSRTYVNFSIKDGLIRGFAGFFGDIANCKIDGYIILDNKDRINFSGNIKNDIFDIIIRFSHLNMGEARMVGGLSPDNILIINLKLDHIKINGCDIVADLVIKNKLVKDSINSEGSFIEGAVTARKVVLNFKSFFNIDAEYKVSKRSFEILSFNIGEIAKLYGNILFKNPPDVDITFLMNNMSLGWLYSLLGIKESGSSLSGIANGKFQIKGQAKKLSLNAKFDIRGGMIGPMDFDYLSAVLKGDFPYIKIEDSMISRKSGYFVLAGEFDLRRIGKGSFFQNIKLLTDETAITWDEWSETQGKDVREVNMHKSFGQQFGVGFKKFMREDVIDESLRDKDEVHFEYNFQPKDSLKVKVGSDKDFVGFQHKDSF